jgi:hypothetical protein
MLSRLEEESRGRVLLGRSELAYIDISARMASSAFADEFPPTFITAVIRTAITGSKKEAHE